MDLEKIIALGKPGDIQKNMSHKNMRITM